MTEQKAKADGSRWHGPVPFAINGRAWAPAVAGFVKIVRCATDRVLAAHRARHASTHQERTVMEFKAPADIARICTAPTLSEVMREAALAVDKRSSTREWLAKPKTGHG